MQLENCRRILGAALAIARGVGKHGNLLARGMLDRIGREQRRLFTVDHGDAEQVVLRIVGIARGDLGTGRNRHHDGNFLLLRQMQPGQRIARVRRADDGRDLLVVDQLGHVLDGLGRRAQIVADHAHDLAAHDAAGLVDVLDRGLEAPAPRDPQLGHAAARHVGVVADLDVLRIGSARNDGGGNRGFGKSFEPVHVCLL
ncbi:hypothetical protein D3C71_1503910 [compost metagenome]